MVAFGEAIKMRLKVSSLGALLFSLLFQLLLQQNGRKRDNVREKKSSLNKNTERPLFLTV